MPTYKITIHTASDNRMEGEKWNMSHDLEKVTALYTKQAIEAIGKINFLRIEVIMVDDDHNHEPKPKPITSKWVPTPKRRDQVPKDHTPLKDRVQYNKDEKDNNDTR